MDPPSPNYGRRLLPTYIDKLAVTDPDHILYLFPKTHDEADGYAKISYKGFANACNRAAWWFEEVMGTSTTPDSVGYIGPNDLRYFILIIGAVKTGHQLLLSSPRNSLEGHLNLIKKSNCSKWLIPSDTNVDHILQACSMETFEVPGMWELLDDKLVKPYPFLKTWDEARRDPVVYLHTSGSTGLPKPVTISQGSITALDAYHLFDTVDGHRPTVVEWGNSIVFSSFPPFHSASITCAFTCALYMRYTIVWPTLGPLSLASVENAIERVEMTGAFLAPSTLEELSKSTETLEKLSKLRWISFGGGPAPKPVGDIIITKTRLWPTIGMTEAPWMPAIVTDDPKDWQYLNFHPHGGIEMREQHSEGLHELVVVRKPELDLMQTVFQIFPELQEFRTKDLYSPHPTRSNLWKYEGREDDIIVLINSEKFNPITMEGALAQHPLIRSALIVGQGKFEIGALLELIDGATETEPKVVDEIWPLVEEANQHAPTHAQLDREHIIVANSSKPFARAGKGTVQRRATIELYHPELEDMYRRADDAENNTVQKLDLSSNASIRLGLIKLVERVSGMKELSIRKDFFAYGFDSLKVLQLQRLLKASLRDEILTVDQKVIYTHPSVESLSRAIMKLSGSQKLSNLPFERQNDIRAMVEKHKIKIRVILTGSTGSLGSYILDELFQNPDIAKIWCLNRRFDALERQVTLAKEKGLRSDWGSKVEFLHTDLSNGHLGLSTDIFHDLQHNVTHILHNAWRVDFNLSLSSFEPQIIGIRNLINLSAMATQKVQFFFISSIGVASNWDKSEKVPEAGIDPADWSVAGSGYGASKLVAEQLLSHAVNQGILMARICRVGQIAGPITSGKQRGMWNRNEWLPTIIDTSAELGIYPRTIGSLSTMDWIPVDILSKIIIEVLISRQDSSTTVQYFHTVNPKVSRWETILPTIVERLQTTTGNSMAEVFLEQWINNLEVRSQEKAGDEIPGTKLLDFYKSLLESDDQKGNRGKIRAVFDTSRTEKVSPTMQSLHAVDRDWMMIWMQQWGY